MPALQVKDCPADVYEHLRACAAEENRSIAQQALTIIEDFLAARVAACDGVAKPGYARAATVNTRSAYVDAPDGIDYVAKRRRTFERIGALAPLPMSDASPSSADILARIRDEEAR